MTQPNPYTERPTQTVASFGKTRSVGVEAPLRFGTILVLLVVFVIQVLTALTLVRDVKEVVAQANIDKETVYRGVITNPETASQLESKIAALDKIILEAEEELDVDIAYVTITCMITVVLSMIFTCTTAMYLKGKVVDEMIRFKVECEKLAVGNLDLDFSTTSYVTEVVELAVALNTSTSELRRIIRSMTIGIDALANKDFSVRPNMSFPGEFVGVEKSFNRLITTIAGTLGEIKLSADQVSVGAHQVASGAQTLAEGASEQAGSVDHLSETIGEIAKMVSDTTESAHSANTLGANAATVLESSTKEMTQLLSAINQIEESSSSIGAVIKTIDDIAFQTNILALNAAIEAARAGQFGKSFAVVADEVRSLAQKSADAAHNSTSQIETSLEAIRQGAALARSTSKSFAQVRENSNQILDMVQHIADSSQQQTENIDEICASVGQITAVIQSNSATSEESAAASEELSGQARVMNEMLSEFKLKENEGRRGF